MKSKYKTKKEQILDIQSYLFFNKDILKQSHGLNIMQKMFMLEKILLFF
ncbi:hypothetical protein LCGC14_1337070 [marine sediment metagenome]|uniref:Uncharacterized protein n=1 Tax=marine sediment metagenome TaxID=412755 RepID=A0A0F9L133_9ZZZZ